MAGSGSRAGVPRPRGRGDELAALDALLANARAGRSGVLVLQGEAGIEKTTLLEHASESASDFTLLQAVSAESEMELAFAALHLLCARIDGFVDRIPAPPRDALEITFGVSAGATPDRSLVALATLSLLAEAAQLRPLLCVIDDAQWLDRASAQVVAFVARRLLAEPVVLLFAAREPTDALAGLPEPLIEGLDAAEARKLLASVIPGRLDDPGRRPAGGRVAREPAGAARAPAGFRRGSWRAGWGCRERYRCKAGSSRASCRGWRSCRRTLSGCYGWRRRSLWAIRRCCGVRPSGSGSRARRASRRSRPG
jgi:AAA ATPase domain